MFEKVGGIEKLEELQSSPHSVIYESAKKMIEIYFDGSLHEEAMSTYDTTATSSSQMTTEEVANNSAFVRIFR